MNNPQRDDAVKRASSMRDKAMAIAMKRKEEYLGARVPKALKERVINKADEMGIPVSLLMRRLLEQSFPEAELDVDSSIGTSRVSGTARDDFDSAMKMNNGLTASAATEGKSLAQENDRFAGIIGWKSIEVNQDRSCERCKEPLPRGMEASLGFTSSDTGFVIVCQQCKTQLIQA